MEQTPEELKACPACVDVFNPHQFQRFNSLWFNCMLQVAERGLQFVHNFAQLLAEQQAASVLPQLFREAWAFSACISLATTTSRLMGVATVLNKQAPTQPASPAKPPQGHRYCLP